MKKENTIHLNSNKGSEFFNVLTLSTVALFALNNWWLKYQLHNWFTGKLSDILFCFFFPLYCSAILSVFTTWQLRVRILTSSLLTLIMFLSIKLSTTVSSITNEILLPLSKIIFGSASINIADPSDIIAIPMILLSILYANMHVEKK